MASDVETEQLNFELETVRKNIQSVDKSQRQKALKDLLQIINESVNDDNLELILSETYLYLIRGYADKYESCRSLSISIVSQCLNRFENRNNFFLEYVIPTMRKRIGMSELIEDSEELQLQLLEQLQNIVVKFSSTDNKDDKEDDILMTVYNDIIDILQRNLQNRYANAARQCCEIIKSLAVATKSFHYRAEDLVDPLIKLLSHRQSASRVLAVETLGVICLHITNKNDKLVMSIVSISPLLMDMASNVRKMCGIVGCKWLMEMRDRYSFFERIIPLVLCCLKDDLEQIRNEINEKFIECGKQYYRENETELQKLALIDNEYPCDDYVKTIAKQRPTLGCRALVQRSLRMINIMVNEMVDWKDTVRLHSLKLLWEIVLYAEHAFTPKFIDVYPVLAKCCQDDEPTVSKEAQRVAYLMGQLLIYDDWLMHTMKSLQKYPTNLGILKCFNSLFAGANLHVKSNSIENISKLVSSTEISHCLKYTFQNAVFDLTEQMVDIYHMKFVGDDGNNKINFIEEKYLFIILVKVIALSNAHDNETIKNRGLDIFNRFCRTDENRVIFQGKYMCDVIDGIHDLDCEHSELSERIIMLYGCIRLCGFQKEYFDLMKSAIEMILKNSLANAQVKILSAVAEAMLKWNHENMKNESIDFLTRFVSDILEPILIWRAGREAEAIRAMATQVLLSIGDACPNEACEIFPRIGKQLCSLSEDNLAITRAYAIRCSMKSGPFTFEDYHQLLKNLLNRLDDPCANVRKFAIECVAELKVDKSDPMFDETNYAMLAEMIISRLILYLDDPYIKIRPILIETLTKLAKEHPIAFQKEIDKLPKHFTYLDEITSIKLNCDL